MSTRLPSSRLSSNPNLEHLKKQAKQLVKDHKAGQVEAFHRMKAFFPRLSNASVHEILAADFTLCNAQLVIAHEYGFTTWKELVAAVTTLESTSSKDVLISKIPSMGWIEEQIVQVASFELPVLIVGESGTGKGLVARRIHQKSKRKDGPYFQVSCSARPEILVESELFGHEAGAFTGAQARKLGKVEVGQGGTLFLGEIGDLSLTAQAKVVRLLEEGTFERHGGTEVIEANVRVIAATNRDVEKMVSNGTFRQDLALFLQKIQVRLPSLRERPEDIAPLVNHFMEEMAVHLGREVPQLSPEADQALQAHDWPGNIRELEHRIQRAVAECTESVIQTEDVGV